MTTLARLFPFFATARGAYSAVGAQVAPSPAAPAPVPAPVAEKPDPRIAVLAAQLVDEHNREVRIAGTVLKLRRIILMTLDQAHRNCLDLQDRNTELRAENERLEREVARLTTCSAEKRRAVTEMAWRLMSAACEYDRHKCDLGGDGYARKLRRRHDALVRIAMARVGAR